MGLVNTGGKVSHAVDGTAAGLKGKMPVVAKPALTFAGVIARSHAFANKPGKDRSLRNFVTCILG